MTTTTTGDALVDAVLAILADFHTKTTIAPDLPIDGEPVQIAGLRYKVLIDDNFHYQDEDHRYEYGAFGTADEAVAACKRIVDEELTHMLKPDTTADALYGQWVMFGEDPYVMRVDRSDPQVTFSAWDYAKTRCEVLARDR